MGSALGACPDPSSGTSYVGSFRRDLLELRVPLRMAAYTAIRSAIQEVHLQRAPAKPREEEYVAFLTLFAIPSIFNRWRKLLEARGHLLWGGSIFCHASPRVRTLNPGSRGCELGDLLVVHWHHALGGGVVRRALLLQAKVVQRLPARPNVAHPQHVLYSTWPEFRYVLPVQPGTRDVLPKAARLGAQYLLFERNPALLVPSAHVARTAPLLDDSRTLAFTLLKVLGGVSGRIFQSWSESASSVGWTRVVWDLLRYARTEQFTRSSLFTTRVPRASWPAPAGAGAAVLADQSPLLWQRMGLPAAPASWNDLWSALAGRAAEQQGPANSADDAGGGPSTVVFMTWEGGG